MLGRRAGRWCWGWAIASVAAVALAVTAPAAGAATILVNTDADVTSDDGQCSLGEAMNAANFDTRSSAAGGECAAGSGTDTVVVPAGSYLLTNPFGAVFVNSDVTIKGAGAAVTTISQAAHQSVVFVSSNRTATISDVTITGGESSGGGAVFNLGNLTLDGCTLSGNRTLSGVHGTDVDDRGPVPPGAASPAFGGGGSDGGDGGAILTTVGSSLTVRNSIVSGNRTGDGGGGGDAFANTGGFGSGTSPGWPGGNATGGDGGDGGDGAAIAGGGSVTIDHSTLTRNITGDGGEGGRGFAGSGGGGGGTGGFGGTGGQGTGGLGGRGGDGGALAVTGPLTIVDSAIESNATGSGGLGGFGFGGDGGRGGNSSGTGGLPGLGLAGNGGRGGDGAGVRAAATLTITGSTIRRNVAGRGGDGNDGFGGDGGDGGSPNGSANDGNFGRGGSGGVGGAGAGVFAAGGATVTNSTITQNTSGQGGAGDSGHGGFPGFKNGSGTPGSTGPSQAGDGGAGGSGAAMMAAGAGQLIHATISANTTGLGGSGGIGIGSPNGFPGTRGAAALQAPGGSTLTNSIVAGNQPAGCGGSVTDGGHDFTFPDASCPGTNADPNLSALADNGGPTRTQALGANSPAVDAVPAGGANCAVADQRGLARPQGAGCDAGAYEKAAPAATTDPATDVGETGATLHGSLNPNLLATTYHFEFGPTTAYGSSTPDQDAGAGSSTSAVLAAVAGLSPGTTYHFRLVASNRDGSTAGDDQAFTTSRPPSAPPGGAAADTTAPVFLSATLAPAKFAIDPKARAEKLVRSRAKKGATFRYRLSEAARVVFKIERVLPGRKVGRKCLKPTSRNRKARRCNRFVRVGSFAAQAVAGANSKKFSGRMGKKALPPGRYRASLTATDVAGNASKPKRLSFRVVRR